MEPEELVYDICRCFLHDQVGVDSALKAKVDGFRRSRNLAELTSCTSHFDWHMHTIDEWKMLRQVEAFFKKNVIFAQKEKCFNSALEGFTLSERLCGETNLRLRQYVCKPYLLGKFEHTCIARMQRYIRNVLGDIDPFVRCLPTLVKVTSGATLTRSRRLALPQLKVGMRPFCTRGASLLLKGIYKSFGFDTPEVMLCHSNRVELVPKNWKTDRTIACEAEGNLALQLAFDSYAKCRLRRFGIDLRDQSANQMRAKLASVHDDYVTVDFTSASDTISYNTVALLFPAEWFAYLAMIRSPGYRGKFGTGCYHKFSSMGNGSTFCIETLIFAAACYAVGSKDFLVYGDDVIIETGVYKDYLQLTRFLGFTINQEKSFSSGPFRESCGGEYFFGVNVTPVYIRNIDKRKASLCHLVNTMLGISTVNGKLFRLLSGLIKSEKLPLVPYNDSTMSGVWIDPGVALTRGILKVKDDVWKFKAYMPKVKKYYFRHERGYYLWFLHKRSQVTFGQPWDLTRLSQLSPTFRYDETSSAPAFDHTFVRKWVHFTKVEGMPVQVFLWPEL